MKFAHTKIFALTLTSSIALGACAFVPGPMPSGYTHHHKTYKSATPPPSSKVTVEQRRFMDAAQAEQFRDAVYDLLERLTMRAGMPPKPVFIMAPDPMTSFYANIDNDLRESMRHIGYALSDAPEGAYIFTYDAMPLTAMDGDAADMGHNVELTLRVFSGMGADARMLTQESGRYYIQGIETLNVKPTNIIVVPAETAEMTTEIMAEPIAEPMMDVPLMGSRDMPAEIVIDTPAMAVPAPIMPEATMPDAPMVEEVIEPMIEGSAIIDEVVETSAPAITAVKEVSRKGPVLSQPIDDVKVGTRDDIVIINHGDRPSASVSPNDNSRLSVSDLNTIDDMMVEEVMTEGNALHDAIPDSKTTTRPRVSQPADY